MRAIATVRRITNNKHLKLATALLTCTYPNDKFNDHYVYLEKINLYEVLLILIFLDTFINLLQAC